MRIINKTRYAILGVLLDGPTSGYEIKSLMGRSTVYFWRESDSTIYPMLKVLAKEGKVSPKAVYSGKKRKKFFRLPRQVARNSRFGLKSDRVWKPRAMNFFLSSFSSQIEKRWIGCSRKGWKRSKGSTKNTRKSKRDWKA